MIDNADKKRAIRKSIAEVFSQLSAIDKSEMDKSLSKKLAHDDLFREAHTIMLYSALPDEVNLITVIKEYALQKQILLPTIHNNLLIPKVYHPNEQLVAGKYNILEPSGEPFSTVRNIDLIIVPGRAFTLSGDRLGRGKGFYDRFLSTFHLEEKTLGICYPFQILKTLPTDPHDIQLSKIIST